MRGKRHRNNRLRIQLKNFPVRLTTTKGSALRESGVGESLRFFPRPLHGIKKTEGAIKKIGLYDQVIEILKNAGKTIVELAGIKPNPSYAQVLEGARLVGYRTLTVMAVATDFHRTFPTLCRNGNS